MDLFDCVWIVLALDSHCDSIGSAEYERCRQHWDEYGMVEAAAEFILKNANQIPDVTEPPAVPAEGDQ